MKTTAVVLYPYFSNYELSIALSALGQAQKPVRFFSADVQVVRSEEQFPAVCDETLTLDLDMEAYDSLLLTGCLDPEHSFMQNARYYDFVRQFDRADVVIGAISSAPILLSMSGVLRDRQYTCGVPREFFEAARLDAANYRQARVVQDGNLITAHGAAYVEFGLRFAGMLGLDVHAGWYGGK